jgi:hypothetical protein
MMELPWVSVVPPIPLAQMKFPLLSNFKINASCANDPEFVRLKTPTPGSKSTVPEYIPGCINVIGQID